MYMCVYLFIYICANSIIHHSNMYSVTYIHACIVFALVYFCTLDTYTRIQIYFCVHVFRNSYDTKFSFPALHIHLLYVCLYNLTFNTCIHAYI